MIEKNLGIKVIIERADANGMSKCLRCWQYKRECRYDENHGCKNLLCNRCYETVAKEFPNDPAFLDYQEERKRIYGGR